MSHLLDANVFITAKNAHYGFDFAPGFWQWITDAHQVDRVFSVDAIRQEIVGGADELATWAGKQPGSFWLTVEAATVPSLTATAAWAQGAGYDPGAVPTFLASGDYYLVAQAHALGFVVVTHEVASNTRKRVKIPDACRALGVPCISPYELLRVEKARLVLGAPPVRR